MTIHQTRDSVAVRFLARMQFVPNNKFDMNAIKTNYASHEIVKST
jgi:hypothetical protein